MAPSQRTIQNVVLGGLALVALLVVVGFVLATRGWGVLSRPTELDGEWHTRFPAGNTIQVTIERLDSDRFRIRPGIFAGVYERRGDRLCVVEPLDPRLTEFVWKIEADGDLVLVEEPGTSKTGSSYLGQRMRRGEPPPATTGSAGAR